MNLGSKNLSLVPTVMRSSPEIALLSRWGPISTPTSLAAERLLDDLLGQGRGQAGWLGRPRLRKHGQFRVTSLSWALVITIQ